MPGAKKTLDEKLEIISKVCDALEGGANSVFEACAIVDVPRASVLWWIDNAERIGIDPLTVSRYARARSVIIDRIAQEIDDIAQGKDRGPNFEDSAVAVARDRLRLDAKKWHLSKIAPKTLGTPKQDISISTEGEGSKIVITGGLPDGN